MVSPLPFAAPPRHPAWPNRAVHRGWSGGAPVIDAARLLVPRSLGLRPDAVATATACPQGCTASIQAKLPTIPNPLDEAKKAATGEAGRGPPPVFQGTSPPPPACSPPVRDPRCQGPAGSQTTRQQQCPVAAMLAARCSLQARPRT